MLNLAGVTSILFFFVCFQALCPCACKSGITVTNVIGQRGSICSLFPRLGGCLGCLLPLFFKCRCVVVLLWLVLVRVMFPGAGGCWPAVSSYVVVIRDVLPTACRDSWPCCFSLPLRLESAASPQRSRMSAAFKKLYPRA